MASERIGLALGSGAARGWAHLGVLRALSEAGINIDLVAGTSMGALVGAVFSAGRIEDLKEAALEMDWKKVVELVDLRLPRSGFVDGVKIEEFVRQHVKGISFADLKIPFAAVATDLYAAEQLVMDRGDLIEAVRASISMPGIFTPVEREGRLLVDGGLVNPVPVSVVRDMGADRVIAVDLNYTLMEKARSRASTRTRQAQEVDKKKKQPAWLQNMRASLNEQAAKVHPGLAKEIALKAKERNYPTVFEVLGTTMNIMEVRITESNLQLSPPDLLIRPELTDLNFLEFSRSQEAMDAGYEAARQALKDWH